MKKKSMNNVTTHMAASAAMLVLTVGVFGSSQALAGIASTKHNLGSMTAAGNNRFDGTAELCVFCHTPHGAASAPSAPPLWNRNIVSATYTTYNSLGTSSLDGATVAVGSVSIACLSCHDGTQAMNVMINQPGSGGYVATGSAMSGAWTGANQNLGKITGLITNLGTDLQNDHPIGIQYGGGPIAGTVPAAPAVYSTSLFKDPDFKPAQSATINSKSVWWVEAGGSAAGSRQKIDMQLYTRTGAVSLGAGATTLTGDQPFVECASCHDPHTDTNINFLRISNANSAVCLACHIK